MTERICYTDLNEPNRNQVVNDTLLSFMRTLYTNPLSIDHRGSSEATRFLRRPFQSDYVHARRLGYHFVGFGSETREPRYADRGHIMVDDEYYAYLYSHFGKPDTPEYPRVSLSGLCSFHAKPISGEIEGNTLHIIQIQGQAQNEFPYMRLSRKAQEDYQERIGFMNWPHILVHTVEQLVYIMKQSGAPIDHVTLPTCEYRGRGSSNKFAEAAAHGGYSLKQVYRDDIIRLEDRYTKPVSAIKPDQGMQQQLALHLLTH
jgi:hypothetical protein